MNKKNIGDSVASDMNDLMQDNDFRSFFARPRVKTAQQEVKETVITDKEAKEHEEEDKKKEKEEEEKKKNMPKKAQQVMPETVITDTEAKQYANPLAVKPPVAKLPLTLPEVKIQGIPAKPVPVNPGEPMVMPETVITDEEAKLHGQSSVSDMVNALVVVSEALDQWGFEKSAAVAIVAAETLMSEAAKKKKDKKDDKKDKKKDKKDDKKLPPWLKGKKGKIK